MKIGIQHFVLGLSLTLSIPANSQDISKEQAALIGLDDEYKAYATYYAVTERFGDVKPFANIINAENMHIVAISSWLTTNGYSVPENPYLNGSKSIGALPDNLEELCALGVEAEIANAALYDNTLLPAAKGEADLTNIFINLRDASQFKHLPAFERCGQGGGKGQGSGMGQNGQNKRNNP